MVNENNQNNIPDWQRQALLAEYKVCQQEASDCVHASWQSGLVFFVTTLTLAGAIIYGLLSTSTSWYRLTLIIILGIFSISLLFVWKQYLTRQHLIRRVMFHRMENIEKELDLRKCSYVQFIDHSNEINWNNWKNGEWQPLREIERKQLWEKYNKEPGRGPKGFILTIWVARAAIIAWVIFIVLEILIKVFPNIRNWLYN